MEQWQPLPHVYTDTLWSKSMFMLRRILDLQVATVYGHLKKALSGKERDILEVGAGARPYRHLVSKEARYRSLDWEGSKEHFHYDLPDTVYYDGGRFPFEDKAFDLLFHTEVMEHVFDVKLFLSECHRVLRSGSKMFLTVPFNARYHYVPHDYWRFTPSCLDRLLQAAGFEDIQVVPRGNDVAVAVVKVNTLFYKIIFTSVPAPLGIAWRSFWGLLFCIPVGILTLIGHASMSMGFASMDDPLGYSVHCRKKI